MLGLQGFPPVFPFWFIRNLFIISLAAPFLHRVLRMTGPYFCVGLTLLWLGSDAILPDRWSLLYTLVFFSWGAYFRLHRVDVLAADRHLLPALGLFLLVSGGATALYGGDPADLRGFPIRLVRLVGGCAGWITLGAIQGRLPDWVKRLTRLEPYAFFLFAAHEPLIRIVVRLLGSPADPGSSTQRHLLGPASAVATIALVTATAWLLRRSMRPVYDVLAGQHRPASVQRSTTSPRQFRSLAG